MFCIVLYCMVSYGKVGIVMVYGLVYGHGHGIWSWSWYMVMVIVYGHGMVMVW